MPLKVLLQISMSFIFLLLSLKAWAESPIVITEQTENIAVTGRNPAGLWLHKSTASSLADILAHPQDWRPLTKLEEYRDIPCSPCWFKIEIENRSNPEKQWHLVFDNAHVYQVDVYQEQPGGLAHFRAGAGMPFSEWSIKFPLPAFPLLVTPGTHTQAYVRLEDHHFFNIGMNVLSNDALYKRGVYSGVLIGALTFAALSIILFAVVFFVLFRQRFFVILIGRAILLAISALSFLGLDYMLLWPDSPRFEQVSNYVTGGLAYCSLSLLVTTYIKPQGFARYLNLAPFFFLPFVVTSIFIPISVSVDQFLGSAGLGVLMGYLVAFAFMAHKSILARYLVLAFSVNFLGVCVSLMTIFGMLPEIPHYEMILPVGVLAEGFIFIGFMSQYAFKMRTLEEQSAILEDFNHALLSEIKERKAIEQQLQEARVHAEAANTARGEFMASISHELRTPLCGIVGMADILKQSDIGAPYDRYVTIINNSAETLLSHVNDLLDFSRLEASKQPLDNRPFGIATTVEATLEGLEVLCCHKDLQLIRDLPANLPQQVIGDEWKLRRILTNLVGNAIKYTAKGQILVSVAQVIQEKERVVMRFSVEDTGPGIREEWLSKLFQPFSRIETSMTRTIGGTGLGLVIAKKLVELMEGEIGVSSAVGKGSTFWFTVRLRLVEPNQEESMVACRQPAQWDGET